MDKLMCPLGDELKVSKEVIEFLEKHHYVDVVKDGEYLFTYKRIYKCVKRGKVGKHG